MSLFKTELEILVNHLNYGNHLGNDSMLSVLQETRLRWLKSINKNFSEISIENTIGFLIKEINMSFESQSHHGDELKIEISLQSHQKTNFTLEYVVTNLSTGKVACKATTRQVCFDFEKEKIAQIPYVLEKIFKNKFFKKT